MADSRSETARLIDRLLGLMENEIVPLTRAGVRKGNKVFGAAILRKSDLGTVIAATNDETENPLWHGEVNAIRLFYKLAPTERPEPKDCIFFSTHEPCPMCLSAIAWGGYDNFYYLFSYQDSRDSFKIGHDLNMLKEVFKHEPGGYARENSYWKSFRIIDLIDSCSAKTQHDFFGRVEQLKIVYAEMSDIYQQEKADTDIPLK